MEFEIIEKPNKLFVGGQGTMGSGIALAGALSGYPMFGYDTDQAQLEAARAWIEKQLGKLPIDPAVAQKALQLITLTNDRGAVSEAEWVLEAVFESLEAKGSFYKSIADLCQPGVLLGTNTSSLPITKIAAMWKNPENVVGAHWFNPTHRMPVAEVIRGMMTTDETLMAAEKLVESFFGFMPGKGGLIAVPAVPIICEKDVPGFFTTYFIVNAILGAIDKLLEGVMSVKHIDIGCQRCFGHAMGPFLTGDLVGLEVLAYILPIISAKYGERFKTPLLITKMLERGWKGMKSGMGFYDHSQRPAVINPELADLLKEIRN